MAIIIIIINGEEKKLMEQKRNCNILCSPHIDFNA